MRLNRQLVLASSSPRRQFLMQAAGFQFSIEKPEVDELFPPELPVTQVARYLASIKAEYFRPVMKDQIIVTADTVVILNSQILNKPKDRNDAIQMLTSLAGRSHTVMTGVSIVSREKEENFDDTTEVTFENLTQDDIEFYVDQFKPYDKAGAYGAQDSLPKGYNPCSPQEMLFLKEINREDLSRASFMTADAGRSVVLIKKISGSYFNVMGLPLHKVFAHLQQWH